jgi:hypothetical protein
MPIHAALASVNMPAMELPAVESMEPRRLLAGPVAAMIILGTEQEVTGIVLTFKVALDPASAQNLDAYFVGRDKVKGEDKFWDPLNLHDPPKVSERVKLQSAVYDPAAQTVTLTPATPFDIFDKFRRVRVSGRGTVAVRDAAGVVIDGNGDGTPGGSALVRARVVKTSRFNFREPDGDRAHFRLVGPGKIWAVTSRRRDFAPVLFLNRTSALSSGLIGKVTPNRRTGDGVVTIRQISGTAFASVPILADPAFRVEVASP